MHSFWQSVPLAQGCFFFGCAEYAFALIKDPPSTLAGWDRREELLLYQDRVNNVETRQTQLPGETPFRLCKGTCLSRVGKIPLRDWYGTEQKGAHVLNMKQFHNRILWNLFPFWSFHRRLTFPLLDVESAPVAFWVILLPQCCVLDWILYYPLFPYMPGPPINLDRNWVSVWKEWSSKSASLYLKYIFTLYFKFNVNINHSLSLFILISNCKICQLFLETSNIPEIKFWIIVFWKLTHGQKHFG